MRIGPNALCPDAAAGCRAVAGSSYDSVLGKKIVSQEPGQGPPILAPSGCGVVVCCLPLWIVSSLRLCLAGGAGGRDNTCGLDID